MNRRRFIDATLLLTVRGTLWAQTPTKVWRIGVLASAPGDSPLFAAFRQGLNELGYTEGKNIHIDYHFAAGQNNLLPALASELVKSNVDLILTDGNAAVRAAKNATALIPIVMGTSADASSSGAIRTLSRPGGNVTGLTLLGSELAGKRLELIDAMVPDMSAIAFLMNPTSPQAVSVRTQTEVAARSRRLRLATIAVPSPSEIDEAFETARTLRVDAIVTMPDAIFWNYRKQLVDAAARTRLPAIFAEREFVDGGGLMSYGPNISENFHRAAAYVDKIFKGARPAELPVEQPTSIELVINAKTAKALGLTIPQSLALLAEIID